MLPASKVANVTLEDMERGIARGASQSDFESGSADFSDYLMAHTNTAIQATIKTYTFDRKASKHTSFELLR